MTGYRLPMTTPRAALTLQQNIAGFAFSCDAGQDMPSRVSVPRTRPPTESPHFSELCHFTGRQLERRAFSLAGCHMEQILVGLAAHVAGSIILRVVQDKRVAERTPRSASAAASDVDDECVVVYIARRGADPNLHNARPRIGTCFLS